MAGKWTEMQTEILAQNLIKPESVALDATVLTTTPHRLMKYA